MNWEESVLAGVKARRDKDDTHWALGDLADGLETIYGDETLATYAEAIGVDRHRLMRYRTVSRAYQRLCCATQKTVLLFQILLHNVTVSIKIDKSSQTEEVCGTIKNTNLGSERQRLNNIGSALCNNK